MHQVHPGGKHLRTNMSKTEFPILSSRLSLLSYSGQKPWSHTWPCSFSHTIQWTLQQNIFFCVQNIPRIQTLLSVPSSDNLVQAPSLSGLDYRNSLSLTFLLLSVSVNLFSTQQPEWDFKNRSSISSLLCSGSSSGFIIFRIKKGPSPHPGVQAPLPLCLTHCAPGTRPLCGFPNLLPQSLCPFTAPSAWDSLPDVDIVHSFTQISLCQWGLAWPLPTSYLLPHFSPDHIFYLYIY